MKYMTPTFQARVAQLALGRVSLPSSAPTDTRMAPRPNTAASLRHNEPLPSDLPSRPETCPIGSEGFNTPQVREVIPKSKDAFIDNTSESGSIQKTLKPSSSNIQTHEKSKTSKPVNVTRSQSFSGRTVVVDHTGASVDAEGVPVHNKKQQPLTNALEPEVTDAKGEMERLGGLSREKTFYEAKGGLRREKTFTTSTRSGAGPTKVADKHISHKLQPLVEVSSSDLDQSVDVKQQRDDKGKLTVPKLDIQEASKNDTKAAEQKPSKSHHKDKNKTGEKSRVEETMKEQHTDNAKGKGKTVKDEARSILQRLTGKKGAGGHKAGQVPSVNRPVRKYTFAKPLDRPEEDREAELSRKPASAPVGRGQPVGASRRGGQDHREGNKPASATGKVSTAADTDTRNLGIKPASAPVHQRGTRAGIQRKDSVRQGSQGKSAADAAKYADVGQSHPKGLSSGQHADQAKHIEGGQSHFKGLSSGQHAGPAKCIEIGHSQPKGLSSGQHVCTAKRIEVGQTHAEGLSSGQHTGQQGVKPREVTKGALSAQRKGHRIQNAMISTSIEASGEQQAEDCIEEEEEEDLGGLHPKLRDSPYLKNNPLLMSKKGRHVPGANRGASGKERQEYV